MTFLFLFITSVQSDCQLLSNRTTRIDITDWKSCTLIRRCYFRNLFPATAGDGAAIHISEYASYSEITDTTILSCGLSSSPTGLSGGNGGGISVGSDLSFISRCCGRNCSAVRSGQFLYVNGIKRETYPTRMVNETHSVECARASSKSSGGSIDIRENVGILLTDLNISNCFAADDGSGFSLHGYNSGVNGTFLNFDHCSGAILISNYGNIPEAELSNCNFFNNNLTTCLFYSNSYGIVVRRCIFAGNSGPLVKISSGQWGGTLIGPNEFRECVFDGVLPTAGSHAVSVSGNHRGKNASFVIRAIDTLDCPAASINRSSASRTPPDPTSVATETLRTLPGGGSTVVEMRTKTKTKTVGISESGNPEGSADNGGGGEVGPKPTSQAPQNWLVLGLGIGIPAAIVLLAIVAIGCICKRERDEKRAAEVMLVSGTMQSGKFTDPETVA